MGNVDTPTPARGVSAPPVFREPDSRRTPMALLERVVSDTNDRQPPDALQHALRLIAEHRDWSVGHAYLWTHGEPCAAPTNVVYERNARGDDQLQEAARELRNNQGQARAAAVMRSGVPNWVTVSDAEPDLVSVFAAGARTAAWFPVRTPDRPVAVLEFLGRRRTRPERELLSVLRVAGTLLAFLVERNRMMRRIARMTANEQQRIAMELHDSVGQEATAIGMLSTLLVRDLEGREAPEHELALRLHESIHALKGRVRDFVSTLRLVDSDPRGLQESLEELAERYSRLGQCVCQVDVDDSITVTDAFSATKIMRIAREALHNAVVHGAPRTVRVTLQPVPGDRIALEVTDDGRGATAEQLQRRGHGQDIMQYRANLLSAELEVQSRPEGGVRVRCVIPLEALRPERMEDEA